MMSSETASLAALYKTKSFNGWREAAWVFILSRIMLMVLAYIGVSRFPLKGAVQPVDCSKSWHNCLLAWYHWDSQFFIKIAFGGYQNAQDTAFFPFWPLLIRIFGYPFVHSITGEYVAGMVLANICFFLALVVLYFVVEQDFEPSIARATLFFLAFSPLGLFFFAPYTESLFLLLSAVFFYLLQKAVRGSKLAWWLAGLCGLCATLTRSPGIALAVPYSVVLLQHYWQQWKGPWEKKIHWGLILNAVVPIILIPMGILIYMGYLGVTRGNPMVFSFEERTFWYRYLDWPWYGIGNAVISLFQPSVNSSQNALDVFFTCTPIIALAISWKRLPLHYTLFAAASALITLMSPLHVQFSTLVSAPRYLLVAFPFIVVYAIWSKHPRLEKVLMVISLAAFALSILLFVTDRWAG